MFRNDIYDELVRMAKELALAGLTDRQQMILDNFLWELSSKVVLGCGKQLR